MISCVIPHWPLSKDHDIMLERCIKSLKGSDETLVIVNNGIGFGKAMNMGVTLSSGDFVCLINNDTVMGDWNLEELTDPEMVTFPIINGIIQSFSGAFICIPRWVIDERGTIYDERYETGFWEDVDFWWWMKKEQIPFKQKNLNVAHPHPGFTMQHCDPQKIDNLNRQKFLDKWDTLPGPLKDWN